MATVVDDPPVWWPNVLFFCGMHLAAAIGIYMRPLWNIPTATIVLCFVSWQLAVFGITIGYHRLYSHRSFSARRPLRLALALMGCLGFQGSIKWWCARHRLHHRYTDDPVHDPYCATKGLYYSHMGWIFRKPHYPRLHLIDRSDLDSDPVVRFQHKHYLELTVGLGLVLPAFIGALWNDGLGGFIWGGLVARLLIWHCTFIVNSFAHWEGLQPYSDEMSARGNLFMALLTGGEGNHNFHHAFPKDYRASPQLISWDPSKWIIELLYRYTGLVTNLYSVHEKDIVIAQASLSAGHGHSHSASNSLGVEDYDDGLEEWDAERIEGYLIANDGGVGGSKKVVLIDGYVVDVTDYAYSHPGGFTVLKPYFLTPLTPSTSPPNECITTDLANQTKQWKDASWAYNGGMNNHSRVAMRKMSSMRVARLSEEVQASLASDRHGEP